MTEEGIATPSEPREEVERTSALRVAGTAAPGAEAAPTPQPAPARPPETEGGRRHHATERGLLRVPVSPLKQGKFGRLFQDLPPLELTVDQVNAIVDLMHEQVTDREAAGGWSPEPTPNLDNPEIPAGYTYLGQFIDHDVTFDPASSLDRQEDADSLHNFRTPRLDLDSVYGAGPQDQPYLYDPVDQDKLLVEPNQLGERDLPRNRPGRALIGDPRNDENMVVSQLHLVFIDAHNRLVDELKSGQHSEARRLAGADDVFREAQRLIRWHYQYVVATDFLWRTCGGIVQVLLHVKDEGAPTWEGRLPYGPPEGGQLRYQPRSRSFMPVEFSAAAYRFGHSQPRPGYRLNASISAALFVEDPQGAGDTRHLGGFRPLLPGWTIEWDRFFDLGTPQVQLTRLIDRRISEPLFFLGPSPPEADERQRRERQLPWRNIMRAIALGLPSGESIALHLGLDPIPVPELRDRGVERTPLWYYVLAEAEAQADGGKRLGEVGGRIVAEVLLGLMHRDRFSFLRDEPGWKPFLGKDGPTARYQMSDFIRYAKRL